MNIINIGILAHVDAGKTTLTESLLYASGAISEPGTGDLIVLHDFHKLAILFQHLTFL